MTAETSPQAASQPEREPAALQQMPGFVGILEGPQHVYRYVNDAYVAISGPRDFVGRSVHQVFPDLAGQGFFELLDEVFRTGKPFTAQRMPVRLARNEAGGDVRERFIDLLYQPIKDGTGAVTGIFVGGYDVTEQVRAQAALQAERDRLASVLEGMGDGFCMLDHDFVIRSVNAEAMRMETRPREAIIGRSHWNAYPGSEESEIGLLYKRAMRDRVPVELEHRYVWEDGHSAWLDMRACPVPEGLAIFYRDVSGRRQAEAERDRALSLLRTLTEAVPGVVYAKDREGRMLVANRGTTELIGKPPSFYLGKTDVEFLDDKAQAAAVMATDQQIMSTGIAEQVEEQVDFPGGSRVVWLSNKAPLRSESGEIIGLIGSSVDITARKHVEAALCELNETLELRIEAAVAELRRTEEALRQSQKMEAVGQLTGGIAHDFNNMLAVVIGSLDLLGRRIGDSDARARRYVDAATEGARRAALLTQRLLAFSRQQPLQPEAIDANRLVASTSDLIRHSLGAAIQLETVLAGGLWRTFIDPNQLENAILNLAINARDAMPEGGFLTIETQNAHLDPRYVADHLGVAAGQYVLIAVTDTGTGMPVEVAARAFDPFFTTKEVGRGTGLGLSQVYGFVRQSGGHVKIYTEPGQGTTVKIYLPRHLGSGGETAYDAEGRPMPLGEQQEVVLVVEDEPGVRQFTVDALTELGYRVLEADGADMALHLLEQHPDIALMFTDVVMPKVNGAKLAREAKALRPMLKILFTTGYTRNAVVHNGVLDPGVALIGKPFTLEELASRVRAMLDAPGEDGDLPV